MEPKYYRNWHLARTETEFKVTEFEWSLIRFIGSFQKWVTTVGGVVIDEDIKFTEHLILHVIRMQDRPKNSATIARLINRDDIPNIQYSLRKLEAANLIQKIREKKGKTFAYTITPLGKEVTDEYAKIRSELLLKSMSSIASVDERLEDTINLLSILTGIYEE